MLNTKLKTPMRVFRSVLAWAVCSLMSAQAQSELPAALNGPVDFARQIQPLFETRCYACHGEANATNGLRLDRKEDALRGGYSGPAILPGDSANSRLIHLVAGHRVKVAMPPAVLGCRMSRSACCAPGATWGRNGLRTIIAMLLYRGASHSPSRPVRRRGARH